MSTREERLEKVRRLKERAATEGQRMAAERAEQRILGESRRPDRTVEGKRITLGDIARAQRAASFSLTGEEAARIAEHLVKCGLSFETVALIMGQIPRKEQR